MVESGSMTMEHFCNELENEYGVEKPNWGKMRQKYAGVHDNEW